MQSGFLLLTLSTEDPSHRGRLIALALSLHEDTASYLSFLSSIKDFLKEKKNYIWNPEYVLSDGAESIHNAVIQVFPQITHILCFFHLKKAVKKHINTIKDSNIKKHLKDNEGLILYGIDLLHKVKSRKAFEDLWALIRTNWDNELLKKTGFSDYFDKQ